jgi:hypothetical protein
MPRPKKKYTVSAEIPTPVVVAPALPVKYLTIKESAVYLCTSPWEIRRLINSGKLNRTIIGNRFIVLREHLDRMVIEGNGPATAKAVTASNQAAA